MTERRCGEWYEDAIEESIRNLVKLLRDNGFNTTCSCGHKMYVDVDLLDMNQANDLWRFLFNNGYHNKDFHIRYETMSPSDGLTSHRCTITVGNWTGEPTPTEPEDEG